MREMKKACIISMGSNCDKAENMAAAKSALKALFGDDIRFSPVLETEPIGMDGGETFLNALALAHTDDDCADVTARLKSVERNMGRIAQEKSAGIIRIDIDLIAFGGRVLKKEDWGRAYVKDLLHSLDINGGDWS